MPEIICSSWSPERICRVWTYRFEYVLRRRSASDIRRTRACQACLDAAGRPRCESVYSKMTQRHDNRGERGDRPFTTRRQLLHLFRPTALFADHTYETLVAAQPDFVPDRSQSTVSAPSPPVVHDRMLLTCILNWQCDSRLRGRAWDSPAFSRSKPDSNGQCSLPRACMKLLTSAFRLLSST